MGLSVSWLRWQLLVQGPLLGFILAGCQISPLATRVSEDPAHATHSLQLEEGALAPGEGVTVIDARPMFEFSLGHFPGALHLRWEEFTARSETQPGVLEDDLEFHARRLARLGLSPTDPVLIVGRGEKGQGEEGRLAWTLAYLGFEQVDFAVIDAFPVALTRVESRAREPLPFWRPQVDESLRVSRRELMALVAQGGASSQARILDVRSAREYLGREGPEYSRQAPDLGAVNIDWQEFFLNSGRVDPEVLAKLEAVGIHPEQRLIVISNQGVRSAAVTMALRRLGFSRAGNFPPGYIGLTQ